MESVLEAVTEEHQQATADMPAVIQAGLDYLVQSLDAIRENKTVEPATDLINQIKAVQSTATDEAAVDIDAEIDSGIEIEEEPVAELPPTEIIELEMPAVEEEPVEEE